MPTYEYVCEKCSHEFEKFQSMKDDALTVCPKDLCPKKTWGKGKVKRQLGSGAGLIFKGSGFYITDYRSEGYKSAQKKDSTPAAASGGDSSGGSKSSGDAKPAAAKPETKASTKKPSS